jgi:tyrosyl-tRNA synthetase
MTQLPLSQELQWRGFIHQTTLSDIQDLDNKPITFYFGVDPSAPSMTIGNLASALVVRHFLKHGHKAVLLIGGATGMIGDPDGKKDERNLKTIEEIERNKSAIVSQYRTLYEGFDITVVDNYDWFKEINYIDFLRDIGKHVPMRQMVGRDFVQSRLSADGAGISYAEFSYVLIQAYDFLHLNKQHDVSLQLCGSDQWGNSIAGVDLIRRTIGKEAHVLSMPLVVNKSTGIKFGKTEEGAVWLSAELTSPYKFYQFWLNMDDGGVEDYLKIYTELDQQNITETIKEFQDNKSERLAQRTLANEVTSLVHGKEITESVMRVSEVLFGNSDYSELNSDDFEILKKELPVVKTTNNVDLVDVLVKSSLCSSKGEARRLILSKSIYINGKQIDESLTTLHRNDSLSGNIIIRRGKNSLCVVEFN